jgi:hypothetical protein
MDLKQLRSIIKIMRDGGVLALKTVDIELTLSPEALLPKKSPTSTQPESDTDDPWKGFPEGTLTPEQLVFYSSGGLPENDPENQ